MACKSAKIVGRQVVLEYAILCGDSFPSESDWKRFGSMRTKEFNLEWETTDATADDSVGALRENLATFQTLTMSGDGTVKVAGGGAANLIELTKHVAQPDATDGQPVAWLRMTFPDLTFTAYMIITTLSRSAPYDDVVTYSLEASATASDFGLVVEDTPDTDAPDPTSVTVIPATLTLAVNDSFDAEAVVAPAQADQNVRWTSSAPAVASVNLITGVVTGVALGSASITATSVADSGISSICTVEVVSAPASVEASPESITVAEGGTATITASVLPATAPQDLSYLSSNPSVATVDASGEVTGVLEGTATITVRSTFAPGVVATVPVTVTP